ncbi:MAG: lysine--tRNA ligase [Phycisphaerales bacterium]|nr:lysine--tRNA ligase [Phycisphaerales bacterium]
MSNTKANSSESKAGAVKAPGDSDLVRARRQKLARWREVFGIDGYGDRCDGLASLAEARATFDLSAHEAFSESEGATDNRPHMLVAGRCVQHRAMGKLVFIVLRDHTGDLQISVSKAAVAPETFKLAAKLDYGDIVIAGGPMGQTNRGEICVWADRFDLACKSLSPPPEKYHGLTDTEARYRQRYVDMYMNPSTVATFKQRSQIVRHVRAFFDAEDFMEVETPMMQPVAGGAAARPFETHHNALDMKLFLRIAPELYLKRLLVGGLPRVYEINRNFRNEGIDRRHNPEFTMLEIYQAFGDCDSMLDLTERLFNSLAVELNDGQGPVRSFGDHEIDYSLPFARQEYGDLFEKHAGCSMRDEAAVLAKAKSCNIVDADKKDHWVLVEDLFDAVVEDSIEPTKPLFVTGFPSQISPLTRPRREDPDISDRSELFIGGMELANAYTELNDPEVQRERFTAQLTGGGDEAAAFRTLDEDFINALHVGMPPAGGLGIGIDRLIMLMCGEVNIRDVILFPLLNRSGTTEDSV